MEMIYQDTNARICLEHDRHEGYEYVIMSYGTHPCAYINIPEDHPTYFGWRIGSVQLGVHGGITYCSGTLTITETKELEGDWVGWDYAHFMDQIGATESDDRHKWTIDEIRDEVFNAIRQLKEYEKGDRR